MCKRVVVMYAGKVVETAEVRDLFNHPAHPYTQGLMKAVPNLKNQVVRLASIEGQPPPLYDLPEGCAFGPRCLSSGDRCKPHGYPPTVEIGNGHWVACWKYVNGN
jgi:oligopeptide/dipeptide ABC transporter ATP-binding protein